MMSLAENKTPLKCDRCENPSAYTRKYSGESLCSECFSQSILRKTAKTISKYDMIKYGQKVCIGVSGGIDSLALASHIESNVKDTSLQNRGGFATRAYL